MDGRGYDGDDGDGVNLMMQMFNHGGVDAYRNGENSDGETR